MPKPEAVQQSPGCLWKNASQKVLQISKKIPVVKPLFWKSCGKSGLGLFLQLGIFNAFKNTFSKSYSKKTKMHKEKPATDSLFK